MSIQLLKEAYSSSKIDNTNHSPPKFYYYAKCSKFIVDMEDQL